MACYFSIPLPSSVSEPKISKASVSKLSNLHSTVSVPCEKRRSNSLRSVKAVSISNPELRTGPDGLVQSILSKVGSLSEKKSSYLAFFLVSTSGLHNMLNGLHHGCARYIRNVEINASCFIR